MISSPLAEQIFYVHLIYDTTCGSNLVPSIFVKELLPVKVFSF